MNSSESSRAASDKTSSSFSAGTPLLGCIADDYTGATDLSSMLSRAGLRVIQCFGTPEEDVRYDNVDAIVISLKSRSVPAKQAIALSLGGLSFLQQQGVERFFFKYCSTFDSTPRGNIGPVGDALADALDATQVIFCPAFPENGRTVYCGYLFVDGVPLHESGMRDHPLNPMTDSNLVRVLQEQSSRPVRLLTWNGELTSGSSMHWLVDAIDDEHLRRIAKLASEHRLLTGGSAIARYWAETLAHDRPFSPNSMERPTYTGRTPKSRQGEALQPAGGRKHPIRSAILAGSCSEATRGQIVEFGKRFPVLQLDLQRGGVEECSRGALTWCDDIWSNPEHAHQPLLICSSAERSRAGALEQWGDQAAEKVEQVFACIAHELAGREVSRFIVAGGETSGAIINALGIKAVYIGREIAPGVPWVEPVDSPHLSLALKSGNFGSPRFFLEALECVP